MTIKSKKDRNRVELVDVTWVDSRHADQAWYLVDGYKHQAVANVRSVGILVTETKDEINLAQSFCFDDDGNVEQVSGVMCIPQRSIVRTTILQYFATSNREYTAPDGPDLALISANASDPDADEELALAAIARKEMYYRDYRTNAFAGNGEDAPKSTNLDLQDAQKNAS